MSTDAEREIDRLEQALQETDDPEERDAIERAIRDIGRELAEEERWREEGEERGWR